MARCETWQIKHRFGTRKKSKKRWLSTSVSMEWGMSDLGKSEFPNLFKGQLGTPDSRKRWVSSSVLMKRGSTGFQKKWIQICMDGNWTHNQKRVDFQICLGGNGACPNSRKRWISTSVSMGMGDFKKSEFPRLFWWKGNMSGYELISPFSVFNSVQL